MCALIASWDGKLPFDGDVILVEDDATLLSLMKEILEDIGGTCYSFPCADDALIRMLSSGRSPGLVVADHGVPGQIKGVEFTSMVTQRWPGTPTILTSGYSAEAFEVPESVIYLQKPWSLDGLVQSIVELLQPGIALRRV
jgi:DNA-binding NtrC family response regulator